jgi:phenylalanyl-tRNA synthetase beta chain
MKVSLEWLSDFIDPPPDLRPAQLAHDLTLKTVEVEDVLEVDDDVVFEIDNKSLTNRPDLWGHYGIAREFAAIYGLPLRRLPEPPRPAAAEGLVGDLDPDLCARFAAVEFAVDGSLPTPPAIRRRLARIGEGGVNFCVDLSNYVMFTVGQPTHVYDADRMGLPLSAKFSTEGAILDLLNEQTVELAGTTPVIRDRDGVVGIAGVMGGASSAIALTARRFVLEAATFRPQPVRRVSQRLNLRTEASVRYEKGLDTQRVDLAVDLFLHLLHQAAPDAATAGMQDVTVEPTASAQITVEREFLDRRIGQRLDDAEILGTLGALGFTATITPTSLRIVVPTWRSTGDVSLPHDIVEELARIHGYDRLPVVRPEVVLNPVRSLHRRSLDRTVREQLALRAGLQEVVTYPWTGDRMLAAAGFRKDETIRLESAPAPDRDSLRPSLVPNLLETVAANLRFRPSFGIFEVGVVFPCGERRPYRGMYEPLPRMTTMLGVALVGDDGMELFRRAKGILEMIRRYCHLTDLSLAGDSDVAWADPSARLAVRAGDAATGTLALLTPRARRLAGIEVPQVACVELDVARLTAYRSRENRFEPLPELPEAEFDLSVVVADEIGWQAIEATAREADELIRAVSYVDEYRGSWVPKGHRSLTVRVTLRPKDITLTADVIGAVRTEVLDVLGRELKAYLR